MHLCFANHTELSGCFLEKHEKFVELSVFLTTVSIINLHHKLVCYSEGNRIMKS